MYKVYKVSPFEYWLVAGRQAVTGPRERVIRALLELGIPVDQVELGLVTMENEDHDMANFGVRKQFIFSKRLR